MKTIIIAILLLTILATPTIVFAGKPQTTALTPNSVCLDPGHGGSDIGSSNQDLVEKDVNLQVALNLRDKLTAGGYTVFLTREADATLSNADRYNYCNAQNVALLVSIHHNGSTDSNTDYTLVLYGKRGSKDVATLFANIISSALGLPNHRTTNFASGVLLKSNAPAVITESFFLTNTNEYGLIKNSNRIDQEASALLTAINSYFGN